MNVLKFTILFFSFVSAEFHFAAAQNPNIKCYFNHPVNTSISSGTDAVYLNNTFADTVAAYIDHAKYTVDIAQYNYTAGAMSLVASIATAANNAYLRGVIVRWIYNGTSGNSGLALLNPGIKTLGSPTTSGYGIMHDKFMVIDVNSPTPSDAITMTASYDWSTTQTKYDYNNIIVIRDQPVALAYYSEFNKMWGGTGAAPDTAAAAFGTHKTASTVTSFNVNGTPVELYFSPKDHADTHLKNAINTANNELFFGIYTFTDNAVANAIKSRYNSGVAVKGIIDQFSETYSPYATLSPVLGANMILYNGNYIYHNKIMVIDGQHPASDPQVLTGSYNWSYSGANSNDENSIIIHDSIIANQYIQSLCQNFADLGGASCTAVLPLKLLYFKALLQQNKTLLQWSIAGQENTAFFVLEKSTDGVHFTDLATINTLPANLNYEYKDEVISNTTTYYKLRSVDKDGSYSYSNTVAVKSATRPELLLYPNPVKDKLFVQFNSSQRSEQTLSITDITGKVLERKTITADAGATAVSFNTTWLNKGTYLLLVQGNESTRTKLFVKE